MNLSQILNMVMFEYAKPSNFPLIIILVLFVNNKNTEIKQLI